MAKYDDFGRPIYETAEEYNKAHRAGSNTRTYDSSEGDINRHKPVIKTYHSQSATGQYGTQKKFKKSTLLIIGVAIYFSVMIVFLMFNMVRSSYGDAYEVMEEEVDDIIISSDDEYGEFLGDTTIPLPEGFETFSYNGQTNTLPSSFDEVLEMGLFLEGYDEAVLFPRECEEMVTLYDEDGVVTVLVQVNNHTEDDMLMGKCEVDYFYIENPVAFDETQAVPDFVFGDGLTLESSYEDSEAYFGVPYYHYEDHTEVDCFYDNYEWVYYGEEETHFVSITFWNGVISDVGIEKRAIEE